MLYRKIDVSSGLMNGGVGTVLSLTAGQGLTMLTG